MHARLKSDLKCHECIDTLFRMFNAAKKKKEKKKKGKYSVALVDISGDSVHTTGVTYEKEPVSCQRKMIMITRNIPKAR